MYARSIELNETHLWISTIPTTHYADDQTRLFNLLSNDEKVRYEQFVFAQDRNRYLASRALVRCVLSHYSEIAPEKWRFVKGRFGRPSIANINPKTPLLDFNLSHTNTVVVLAISGGNPVGVDVELLHHEAPLDIAIRFFNPKEIDSLLKLPQEERSRRFWELWTLKESYIKARGVGLSLALDSFSFSFPGKRAIVLEAESSIEIPSSHWSFLQATTDDGHMISLCVSLDTNTVPSIHCSSIIPFHAPKTAQLHICRSSIAWELSI